MSEPQSKPTQPKRFELKRVTHVMENDPTGEWVRFDDHQSALDRAKTDYAKTAAQETAIRIYAEARAKTEEAVTAATTKARTDGEQVGRQQVRQYLASLPPDTAVGDALKGLKG